jgi:hypothetical protein
MEIPGFVSWMFDWFRRSTAHGRSRTRHEKRITSCAKLMKFSALRDIDGDRGTGYLILFVHSVFLLWTFGLLC